MNIARTPISLFLIIFVFQFKECNKKYAKAHVLVVLECKDKGEELEMVERERKGRTWNSALILMVCAYSSSQSTLLSNACPPWSPALSGCFANVRDKIS